MNKHTRQITLRTISSYLLWIVSAITGIGVALIGRDLLVKLYARLMPSPWTIGVVDKAVVVGLILCWVILVLLCERYYLKGAREGKLLRRFAAVIIPSLIVLGLGWGLGSFS